MSECTSINAYFRSSVKCRIFRVNNYFGAAIFKFDVKQKAKISISTVYTTVSRCVGGQLIMLYVWEGYCESFPGSTSLYIYD